MSGLRKLVELQDTFSDKELDTILDLGTEALKLGVADTDTLRQMVWAYYLGKRDAVRRDVNAVELRRTIVNALDAYVSGDAS